MVLRDGSFDCLVIQILQPRFEHEAPLDPHADPFFLQSRALMVNND